MLRALREESASHPAPQNVAARQQLSELREALLRLHKTLLESERESYEQAFGRIQSPYHFLQLLTGDPWFAWLHPLSHLITVMDEIHDSKEPLTPAMLDALVIRAKSLLVATEGGEGFSRHYDEALQRTPDAVFAAADAAKIIRKQMNASTQKEPGDVS